MGTVELKNEIDQLTESQMLALLELVLPEMVLGLELLHDSADDDLPYIERS